MEGLEGEEGVVGRLLSADWARLLAAGKEGDLGERFGDGHRFGAVTGVEAALYLDAISRIRGLRATPLFFSDGPFCTSIASSASSHTSIHTHKPKPH